MMNTATSSSRTLGAVVTITALLAVGLPPMVAAPEISSRADVTLSTEVALVTNTVVGGFESVADAAVLDTPGAADAFDLGGLLNAEFAAAQGLFNSIVSLPGTLINDVEDVFTSLTDLNFGAAFSALFAIPQDIINYVLGLPGTVVNTLYEMAVVIPGEFLFNFG